MEATAARNRVEENMLTKEMNKYGTWRRHQERSSEKIHKRRKVKQEKFSKGDRKNAKQNVIKATINLDMNVLKRI